MKQIIPALLTAFALLLTGCSSSSDSSVTNFTMPVTEEGETVAPMTVTFMKVGKADAAILQTSGHTVVIDCGEATDGKKMTARLQENGVDTIDCMILSHYDQDHIGGAPELLQNFNVKQVIGAVQEEDTEEYQQLCSAVADEGLTLERQAKPKMFVLDNAAFIPYPHQSNDYKEGYDNNCSLVVKVVHNHETLLFTGDAMEERLAEIMEIGDVDLLKVPYHGREIANLPQFLENTKPEYAVISTKEKELSSTTTDALDAIGAETYMTFRDGNIVAVSDGDSITITKEGLTEKEES